LATARHVVYRTHKDTSEPNGLIEIFDLKERTRRVLATGTFFAVSPLVR
jgi:hypothetical protein